ncbi:MAG TPA: hypothetical protein VK493_11390 [Bryobacteraceae bacterium]|nr:hypothetical protein [Bryobacteraceae bacterium]
MKPSGVLTKDRIRPSLKKIVLSQKLEMKVPDVSDVGIVGEKGLLGAPRQSDSKDQQ